MATGRWEPLRSGPYGVAADQAGVDPMWVWAEATDYRDFGVPALDPSSGIRFAVERTSLEKTAGAFTSERLTPLEWQSERGRIARIEIAEPVVPERARPRKSLVPRDKVAAAAKSNANVLVGIIDSGCPFAAKMIREPGGQGTRVLSIWDQDDQPAFSTLPNSFVPERHRYGRAINRDALNAVMQQATYKNVLDEEQCYRDAGYDAVSNRFSHGGAVISQLFAPPIYGGTLQPEPGLAPACYQPGVGSQQDAAASSRLEIDSADLVFVQMPSAGIQDSTSAALTRYLIDGLRYILDHASGHENQRVVVNISSGTSRTTHDGKSLLEMALSTFANSYIDDVTGKRLDLTIVIPAGNTNEEQRFGILSDDAGHLEFFLPPGCEMPQYVTVRWPPKSCDVRLRVTPPGGATASVASGEAMGWPNCEQPECGVVLSRAGADGVAKSLIAFAPTSSVDPTRVVAMSGRWRFELDFQNQGPHLSEPVMFWISRNQRNPGALARGRQADFVDWDESHQPERYLRRHTDEADARPRGNGIRRNGAMSGLATAEASNGHVVVVGSLVMSDPADPPASRYSAAGPAAGQGGQRTGPDFSAPGDASWALPGLSTRANRSGDLVRVTGTSFAAPLVARAIVNGFVVPGRVRGNSQVRTGGRLLP